MRLGAALGAAVLVSMLAASSPGVARAEGEGVATVSFVIPPVIQVAPPPAEVPVPEAPPVPIPEAIPPPTPPLEDIARWVLRHSDGETLIRYYWRDTPHVEQMLRIARRESGMRCNADNPTSSAAGLFQTIGSHRRLAEGMGLTWANVTGPDCWDDVRLAWQLYDHGRGLRHWALTR